MKSTRCYQLLATIMLLILAANGLAQNEHNKRRTTDTYGGLHLSISLDGDSYRLGDIATVKVSLKNVGDGPIRIYKKLGWGCFGSLGYGLSDSRGRGLMPTFIPGSFYAPPFLKEDFITLQPGEVIETERLLQVGRHEGITKPGTYRVGVWYNSPVSKEFAPKGMEIWEMENGDLVAKQVKFTVTE